MAKVDGFEDFLAKVLEVGLECLAMGVIHAVHKTSPNADRATNKLIRVFFFDGGLP
jgi:hypothetical protein